MREIGLRNNWKQFSILVLVNAFVGGMVGMERNVLPQLAEEEYGLASRTAILGFITAFGITKAFTNYFTGRLANKYGRKKLLVIGWLFALPVPFLLMYAPSWGWIIVANIFLGINQGLSWSTTVIMKIDLVGPKNRGLAMGFNEFSGYMAVGLVALLSGYVAHEFGLSPYPFFIGIVLSVLGLVFSFFLVKDTLHFVEQESQNVSADSSKQNLFLKTSVSDKTLSSITQAGLVNNLNDGMIWGLFPLLLAQLSYNKADTGILTALYPAVWGLGQLFTGRLADIFNKKSMLFWGMLMQGLAIFFIPINSSYFSLALISVFLGLGTALVYPTFLAAIAQATHPKERAESIGVFRLWRDLGYAIGAILSGIIADAFGIATAIFAIGALTILSSLVIKLRMPSMSSK